MSWIRRESNKKKSKRLERRFHDCVLPRIEESARPKYNTGDIWLCDYCFKVWRIADITKSAFHHGEWDISWEEVEGMRAAYWRFREGFKQWAQADLHWW